MEVIGEGDVLTSFHGALAAVERVAKGEEADMGRYTVRYASLNAVHAECVRACELHHLVVCQEPTVRGDLFAVVNTLIHADSSRIVFEPMCLPLPRDAQALGSATTYLRRYSLVSQFGIDVADDDGREATTAARTQPGMRTEAERLIRESVGAMPEDVRALFTADFRRHFGCGLSDLAASKHGDALTWAREWQRQRDARLLAENEAEDATQTEEAPSDR